MHALEPYYAWRNHYVASQDPQSPFYDRVYNEFAYHLKVYNHFIHPQWDEFGSQTLYTKILYADYDEGTPSWNSSASGTIACSTTSCS